MRQSKMRQMLQIFLVVLFSFAVKSSQAQINEGYSKDLRNHLMGGHGRINTIYYDTGVLGCHHLMELMDKKDSNLAKELTKHYYVAVGNSSKVFKRSYRAEGMDHRDVITTAKNGELMLRTTNKFTFDRLKGELLDFNRYYKKRSGLYCSDDSNDHLALDFQVNEKGRGYTIHLSHVINGKDIEATPIYPNLSAKAYVDLFEKRSAWSELEKFSFKYQDKKSYRREYGFDYDIVSYDDWGNTIKFTTTNRGAYDALIESLSKLGFNREGGIREFHNKDFLIRFFTGWSKDEGPLYLDKEGKKLYTISLYKRDKD